MKPTDVLPRPLRGILPPLITPLRDPDTLDVEGLERLIEHVIAGGASGLFLLGSTGEAPNLSYRLRRELITRTCHQAGFRVPVLVGVSDTSLVEAVALACHAADAGAHAIVSASAYYFPLSQGELLDYCRTLAAQTPLPLLLYNMPAMTKVRFELDTVRRLMEVPSILGIKDSSGDMIFYHHLVQLRRQRSDWAVLMGPEELMAESVLLGGTGGVTGGANLEPRLYVDLYEAAAAEDLEGVRKLQTQVLNLGRIYRVGEGGSAYLRGLKCALAAAGICDDALTAPFERLGVEERARVRRLVEELASPVRPVTQEEPMPAGKPAGKTGNTSVASK
jgi:4-hydroxy-tetrahydrodipicolinate synthase